MTGLALVLVVLAAFAHAGWNFFAKASTDKLIFSWCFTVLASIVYLPLMLYQVMQTPIAPAAWIFIVGTMLLHIIYFWLLAAAYARADLSIVYPVARGSGILFIPFIGTLVLGESVSAPAVAAIAIILAGVVIVHTRGTGTAALKSLAGSVAEPGARLALLTGCVIAAYTTWDKQAVQTVAPPIYIFFIFVGQAALTAPVAIRRWKAVQFEVRKNWRSIVAAALLSPLSYLLVLTALTFSRVTYVAPARELSIAIGSTLGTLVLREPHGGNRVLGSILIVAGVVGLALAP